jgi:hypothetical protein
MEAMKSTPVLLSSGPGVDGVSTHVQWELGMRGLLPAAIPFLSERLDGGRGEEGNVWWTSGVCSQQVLAHAKGVHVVRKKVKGGGGLLAGDLC